MKLANFVVVLLKKQLPIYFVNTFKVDLSCFILNPTNVTNSVILITIFFIKKPPNRHLLYICC